MRGITSVADVEAGAVRWRCARCSVSVGLLDGATTGLPATWTRHGESVCCLGCSRAMAGEEALDSASPTCSRQERFLMRREAVIRFELERTPLAPDRTIAQVCRTSPRMVANVRAALPDASSRRPTAPSGV